MATERISLFSSKRFSFIYLLLLTCLSVNAQSPVFHPYNPLKKNEVVSTSAIFQDNNGFIWFGTNKGLFKFDGVEWLNYNVSPSDSITSNHVTAITQDSLGHIWVGLKSGQLSTFKDGHFSLFENEEGSAIAEVSKILFDKNGILWYATKNDGLYYIIEDRTHRLDEDEGLPDTYIYDMLIDNQGNIWAGTDGGIAIISLQADNQPIIKTIAYDQGLPDNIVRKLVKDSHGDIWIGTEDAGIAKYETASEKLIYPVFEDNWTLGAITDIALYNEQLWIGTSRKGLAVIDIDNYSSKLYDRGNGFPSSGVQKLTIDKEGNIWVGSKNGIFRVPGNNIEFISDLSPLTDKNVSALDIDKKGNIWFVTYEGFFKRNNSLGGKVKIDQYLKESTFSGMSFISVYVDEQEQIWVGTYGNGIIRFNPATGTYKHLSQEQLPNGNILNITGQGDQIWLATLGGGTKIDFSKPEDYKITHYGKEEGLSTNYIYQVFIDSKGKTWFATDGEGVSLMGDQGFTSLKKQLSSKVIYGFAEDRNGHIWVNTKEEGLYKYDGEEFVNINDKNGLRDLNITNILADKHGDILVFHDLGIDVYDVNTNQVTRIGESFGIKDQTANLNAIARDEKGNIFIGTDQGMIKFTSFEKRNRDKPVPYINRVNLFTSDVNYANSKDILFQYDENNLTINYIGFWYQNAQNLEYRYKLDNYELNWITSKNREVTYSSLPPGEYNFRLQVSETDNFDNTLETSVSFYIKPPFWRTIPFYIFITLVLISLVYLFVKGREKKLIADKKVLEDKVEERTQEIKKQNEEIAQKSENITRSINYAKRIQHAILPLNEHITSAFPEHFIFYKPRDIVSGDFYWMHFSDEIAYFAVIDCTGHGVPGAFMSLIGYSLLNEIVSANSSISPAEILSKLDKGVVDALKQRGEEGEEIKSYDGMDVSLCSWHAQKKELIFSGAKRPLYLINKNSELIEYKGDKISIGGKKATKQQGISFTNQVVDVKPGEKVYMFSDGYPDQFGGLENRKFMTKKLKNSILENHHLMPQEQHEYFEKMLKDWQAEIPQTDDILLAGLFF